MKNNQLLPFERNRYYTGKMLTSADFSAEQLYMNNKRRFLNHVMYGRGVVCGLGVTNLDDLSILIESGVAMDGEGREIVVPNSLVKKLSSIEGFDELVSDDILLGIRYKEENAQPVYSIAGKESDEQYEYNRIREDYELYLTDVTEDNEERTASGYLLKHMFLKQEDFRVFFYIPKTVAKGKKVKLRVKIEKLSNRSVSLTFRGILQLPVFQTDVGSHELIIEGFEITLAKGGVVEQEYWLTTQQTLLEETSILLKSGSGYAYVGEYECSVAQDLGFKIQLKDIHPVELALSELGMPNYEKRREEDLQTRLHLARFKLLRTEGAYVIDQIQEMGVKSYISTPYAAEARREYLSYFLDQTHKNLVSESQGIVTNEENGNWRQNTSIMASGSIEIPLDVDMKRGDVCFSEEIMHGLGKGNVYVDVGVQSLETDLFSQRNTKTTIYGNTELFPDTGHMWVQTAVKVFHDKGSFQVAARLVGEQSSIVLLVNWVATKFLTMEESRMEEDYTAMNIIPESPTIRMGTRESYCFRVRFDNMKPCRLTYELTESGSGEITSDGVYTAPSKDGVYEIHIFCTDVPEISTYVYAVVKKTAVKERKDDAFSDKEYVPAKGTGSDVS